MFTRSFCHSPYQIPSLQAFDRLLHQAFLFSLKKSKRFVCLFNISGYLCDSKVVVEMAKGCKIMVLPLFLLMLIISVSIGKLPVTPFIEVLRSTTSATSFSESQPAQTLLFHRVIHLSIYNYFTGATSLSTQCCNTTTYSPPCNTFRPGSAFLHYCRLLI